MGRDAAQEAKQFFKENCNLTDSTTTSDRANQSYRSAAEQIADGLNEKFKGLSEAQKKTFIDTLANESKVTLGEYAEFSKSTDGHLHVRTRGYDVPINFGFSQDNDLNAVMQKRAGRGGYGVDLGDGPSR